jgi:hypothetical protein
MMYESGIAVAQQRVGSLLNYAATRNVAQVKSLEPELYGRIVSRYNNVEFMAQFAGGYARHQKPADDIWKGNNHGKAGKTTDEENQLSDRYEHMLKRLGIPYERGTGENSNNFKSSDPAFNGKVWTPFNDVLNQIAELNK